jgi:hypothetical protein
MITPAAWFVELAVTALASDADAALFQKAVILVGLALVAPVELLGDTENSVQPEGVDTVEGSFAVSTISTPISSAKCVGHATDVDAPVAPAIVPVACHLTAISYVY